MTSKKLSLYSIPALLFAALLLAGCETTAGLGRDVEAAGEGIEDTAERHQPYGEEAEDDRAEAEVEVEDDREGNMFD